MFDLNAEVAHQSKDARSPRSHTTIVEEIRAQIVSGEMAPGERLPTRTELERRFKTTKTTLQRAFNVLLEEGFITAEGTRGTFVAERPPHLSRYALVFHGNSASKDAAYFETALKRYAKTLEDAYGIEFVILNEVDARQDLPDYQRLLQDMQKHRLAGVVFAYDIGYIAMTSLLQVFNVPLVAIMARPNDLGIPIVKIDYSSFFNEALTHLANRGRQRVAAINPNELNRVHFKEATSAHGLETRDYWWLPVNLFDTPTARIYTQLLMNSDQTVRPDALIISNDNLVEHVVAGLSDVGVRVPEDVEIVAHGNFPTVPDGVPMRRLGYSPHQILETCLQLLQQQRTNEIVASVTEVEAVFEDSLSFIPSPASS